MAQTNGDDDDDIRRQNLFARKKKKNAVRSSDAFQPKRRSDAIIHGHLWKPRSGIMLLAALHGAESFVIRWQAAQQKRGRANVNSAGPRRGEEEKWNGTAEKGRKEVTELRGGGGRKGRIEVGEMLKEGSPERQITGTRTAEREETLDGGMEETSNTRREASMQRRDKEMWLKEDKREERILSRWQGP